MRISDWSSDVCSSDLNSALNSFSSEILKRQSLEKRLQSGLRPAQDQRVHVVRAFVRVDHLEIDQMAGDAELVGNTVAAQHVARQAGHIQRLAAGIALRDRRDFHGRGALVLHASQQQAALQRQRRSEETKYELQAL